MKICLWCNVFIINRYVFDKRKFYKNTSLLYIYTCITFHLYCYINQIKNIKQGAHWPHRSPKNTFGYTITFLKRGKIHNLLFENCMVLYFNKLEYSSPNDAVCQIWLKLTQWLQIKRFLNFVNYFNYFLILSPWKQAGHSFCRNVNSQMLCAQYQLKFAKWFWRRFLNFVNVFSQFHNYLTLKTA